MSLWEFLNTLSSHFFSAFAFKNRSSQFSLHWRPSTNPHALKMPPQREQQQQQPISLSAPPGENPKSVPSKADLVPSEKSQTQSSSVDNKTSWSKNILGQLTSSSSISNASDNQTARAARRYKIPQNDRVGAVISSNGAHSGHQSSFYVYKRTSCDLLAICNWVLSLTFEIPEGTFTLSCDGNGDQILGLTRMSPISRGRRLRTQIRRSHLWTRTRHWLYSQKPQDSRVRWNFSILQMHSMSGKS